MLGKGRGKATYLRKRCIKQAEVLASARVSVQFLGQGAAQGVGRRLIPAALPLACKAVVLL